MKPARRSSSLRRPAPWLFAALLLAAGAPLPAQELGRVFFTPERREALDRRRAAAESGQPDLAIDEEAAESAPLVIDGVVTRSAGRGAVWINGAPQESGAGEGVAVVPDRANPGRVVVRAHEGPLTPARVGDTVKPATGETSGLLGGGRIDVKRAARPAP
ncbi:MAG: hypothetical protein LBS70_07530 [Candidatus Accumulibacter sp.]|jgi:hypothetical protein|nr:hypothetical protein [Accumulibacter sp.]